MSALEVEKNEGYTYTTQRVRTALGRGDHGGS
jgi:hypothetical protein